MSNMTEIIGQAASVRSSLWMPEKAHDQEKPALLPVQIWRQAAIRLADLRRGAQTMHTGDLVGLLVCQAARNRRVSQPRARIHLHTSPLSGPAAGQLSIRLNIAP